MTNYNDLSGRTTVVVGASRGLGRGIARAFAEAGAPVVAVARTGSALAELGGASANIRTEVADAADATVAWSLLDQYEPEVLFLVAGANPVMRTFRVVAAGSRAQFIAMNRAIAVNRLRPVIDRVFPFDKVVDAFHYYERARLFGKIVISQK